MKRRYGAMTTGLPAMLSLGIFRTQCTVIGKCAHVCVKARTMNIDRRTFLARQLALIAALPSALVFAGSGAARAQSGGPAKPATDLPTTDLPATHPATTKKRPSSQNRVQAVVELFTSQACSACPPADLYLAELAKRPDVVALAYHVDYWDYIGWVDTFGTSENSQLQRAYSRANHKVQVYTPQIIVNGSGGVVGSNRPAVESRLQSAKLTVELALSAKDGMLSIRAAADAALPESAVYLIPYIAHARVAIAAGENKGRKIGYTNIALGRQVLGMWEPREGARIRLPLSEILVDGADSLAVIVQQEIDGLPGPILGAAAITP